MVCWFTDERTMINFTKLLFELAFFFEKNITKKSQHWENSFYDFPSIRRLKFNDFYKLWQDENLSYECQHFATYLWQGNTRIQTILTKFSLS